MDGIIEVLSAINWPAVITVVVLVVLAFLGREGIKMLRELLERVADQLAQSLPPEMVGLFERLLDLAEQGTDEGRRTAANILRTLDIVKGATWDDIGLGLIADQIDPDVKTPDQPQEPTPDA